MKLDVTYLYWEQLRHANLMTAVTVEDFNQANEPTEGFYKNVGKPVRVIADSQLPDKPIFVLSVGKSYRLRIILMNNRLPLPIKRVIGARMLLPKQRALDVNVEQEEAEDQVEQEVNLVVEQETANDFKCEAVALLKPNDLGDQRLRTVSPPSVSADEKYVELDLAIQVSITDHGGPAFDMKHKLHCQIVTPAYTPNTRKFVREYKAQGWDNFNDWKKISARASVAFAFVDPIPTEPFP